MHIHYQIFHQTVNEMVEHIWTSKKFEDTSNVLRGCLFWMVKISIDGLHSKILYLLTLVSLHQRVRGSNSKTTIFFSDPESLGPSLCLFRDAAEALVATKCMGERVRRRVKHRTRVFQVYFCLSRRFRKCKRRGRTQ